VKNLKLIVVASLVAGISFPVFAGGSYDDSYLVDNRGDLMLDRLLDKQEPYPIVKGGMVERMQGAAVIDLSTELTSDESSLRSYSTIQETEFLTVASLNEAQQELDQAKTIRMEAERESMQRRAEDDARAEVIELAARQKAQLIEEAAIARVAKRTLDPVYVMSEQISFPGNSGKAVGEALTIEQIARAIMPEGWTIFVDFHVKPEIANRTFIFTSTDPRDTALRKLTASVADHPVYYSYLWDLVDAGGKPSPTLILTDKRR
jgi:hypothetical protein